MSAHGGEISDELSRLLIELVDGRLHPIGAARLSQILREDDDAVDAYVRYVGIHSLLDWRFARPQAADEDATKGEDSLHGQHSLRGFHYVDDVADDDETEALLSPPLWTRPEPVRPKSKWRLVTIVSSLAAMLVLAFGIAALLMVSRGPSSDVAKRGRIESTSPSATTRGGASHGEGPVAPSVIGPVKPPASIPGPGKTAPVAPAPMTAASVAVAIGVGQDGSAAPLVPGTPLVEGQRVRLTHGYVELTFGGGARAIIEAPSEFTIDSPTAMSLSVGRVAATASGRAKGFVVRTNDADVTDLGTQFGRQRSQGRDGRSRVRRRKDRRSSHDFFTVDSADD